MWNLIECGYVSFIVFVVWTNVHYLTELVFFTLHLLFILIKVCYLYIKEQYIPLDLCILDSAYSQGHRWKVLSSKITDVWIKFTINTFVMQLSHLFTCIVSHYHLWFLGPSIWGWFCDFYFSTLSIIHYTSLAEFYSRLPIWHEAPLSKLHIMIERQISIMIHEGLFWGGNR